MSNIRLYIGNLYSNIYNILFRLNKYLLFRSKYLYLGTSKVLKLPKVTTKQVLEEMTEIEIYDGKKLISDEWFNMQLEYGIHAAVLDGKVVDLRDLPKGYMILTRGEASEV